MINGDYEMFVNDLHYGAEMDFSYKDRQYFIQGWYEDEKNNHHMELVRYVPLLEPNLWEYDSNESMSECAKAFMKAKIFDGKTFSEIESEVEWLDGDTYDKEQATKEYWEKHPNEIPDGVK